jgi:hypothetical protein
MAQADEGRAAGFTHPFRINESGGEYARGLYQPVALLTVAVLGGSADGVGVAATRRSTDTQAEAAPRDRRPSGGRRR